MQAINLNNQFQNLSDLLSISQYLLRQFQLALINNNIIFFPKLPIKNKKMQSQQQQMIKRMKINIQRFKCSKSNRAFYTCINKQCQYPAFTCNQQKCDCKQRHYKCHSVQLKRVVDNINQHAFSLSTQFKQSYQTIIQNIQKFIQRLTKLKQKFQKEMIQSTLHLSEVKFINLANESNFDQINGKLICQIQNIFNGQNKLVFPSKFQVQAIFDWKNKKITRMINLFTKTFRKQQFKPLKINSKIIKTSQYSQLLQKWIFQTLKTPIKQIKLVYRGSQNNFSSKAFFSKCQNIDNTVVIVKTEFDKIIGGFNPNTWKIAQKDLKFFRDQKYKSFLFSLSLKQKYCCIQHESSTQYHFEYGPKFGSGADLAIHDKADVELSYAFFPTSYNYGDKYKRDQQTISLFTGNPNGYKFRIKQYQVYKIQSDAQCQNTVNKSMILQNQLIQI